MSVPKKPAKKAVKKPAKKTASASIEESYPLMAGAEEKITRSRRNVSGVIERTDRFKNIDDGLVPFKFSTGAYSSKSTIDIRDAVMLCQKAYYNFAVFRNTIDLMTEFSVNNIYFRGGSKKARKFFEAFFKKINLWSFQDKFFREYYRSGNVFIYRFDSFLRAEDLRKITQAFGSSFARKKAKVPTKYILLNPADIRLMGSLSFAAGTYSKHLTDYELQRLRSPQTEEDEQLLQSLSPDVRKSLTEKGSKTIVTLPLDKEKVMSVFYKKQDYEPFSVPMGYPVLEDINYKSELKKMDMAIARTMQQAILLVTMGTEPEKGGINQRNLEAMQKLFENQSVGRVLISDYTTKAQFVIPQIADILDPKKYEVLDKDIRIGLNNILIGENEKFANQSIKVKVFIERLKQARETFMNEFLMPEIKRICRELGFKNYPTPYFEDIDLRDGLQYSRIYNRLMELGILTPEEGIKAIESGILPDEESSVESQEKFSDLKDKGLYEPLIGGARTTTNNQPKKPDPKENGRPAGSNGIPQEQKNISPIERGKSIAEDNYSLSKLRDNMILAQKLELEVEKELRKLHKIKRLNKKQKDVGKQISETIIANTPPEEWTASIGKYVGNPVDQNTERVKEVENIVFEHNVDYYLASLLLASKTEG